MRRFVREWLTPVFLLLVPGLGLSQGQQGSSVLVITGRSGQAPITELHGRSYVAIDDLARLMNIPLSRKGNEMVLGLPARGPENQSSARPFSREFVNVAIETVSQIREWHGALMVAVENGYKLADAGIDRYRAQAAKNLQLAAAAATTDSDRSTLPLLQKELGHMQQLNDKVAAARKSLSYISPRAFRKDSLNLKTIQCAQFLGEMTASGQFQDDGSCR
jgi:hypothetical protein